MVMPSGGRGLADVVNLRKSQKRIEPVLTSTSNKRILGVLVLNTKIGGMKFKEYIIIRSELMY